MEENKVMKTTETTSTDLAPADENYEIESSGKGWIVKAIGTVVIGTAVFGVYKTKGLIEKRTIKKLRKKGYTILEPDTDEETVEGDYIEEPVEPEEENE